MIETISPSEHCPKRVSATLPVMPWAILALLWCAGSVAAAAIAKQKHLPVNIAIPIAAAFLLELTMWACVKRMAQLRPAVWVASAVAPYLVLTLPTGLFQWWHAFLLVVFTSALSFWLSSLDARWDWAFLILLSALLLFPRFCPELLNMKIPTLGRLMWFRLSLISVLAFRDHERLNFGYWPTAAEWWIGTRTVLLIIPVAVAVNAVFPVVHFRIVPGYWWKAPGYFFAFLWTVGLAEEVLARGLLLEWARKRAGLAVAVVVSSLLFGSVHLWFRHFPNYSFAVLASIVGALYALAYLTGRGVRASTVSHAVTVAAWKVFFSG